MNTSAHLSDNLSLLAHETSLLIRTAGDLDDQAMRQASLCEGWTRAHVLSHIARNADGTPLTGTVMGRIVNAYGKNSQRMLLNANPVPYKPVSLDTAKATLTSHAFETMEGN